MDKDNKNILLYRKIILLNLGLITCLRWYRVDIEKVIAILLKTYWRVCRAKESHVCLWAKFSVVKIFIEKKKKSSYFESRYCYLQLALQYGETWSPLYIETVTWPIILDSSFTLPFHIEWTINSYGFSLLHFSILAPLLQLLCLCLSLDSHHFLTGLRTGCFTSVSLAPVPYAQ